MIATKTPPQGVLTRRVGTTELVAMRSVSQGDLATRIFFFRQQLVKQQAAYSVAQMLRVILPGLHGAHLDIAPRAAVSATMLFLYSL